MDTRWQDITRIWEEWRFAYEITAGVFLVLLGIWIGLFFFASDSGYSTNIYTEVLSVAFTIFVLNKFAENRERKRLQEQLVREASSRDNSTAVSAVDWMRYEGWLQGEDSLLKNAYLGRANLEEADFSGRLNLSGVILNGAKLSGVNLSLADLSNSSLMTAKLTNADLGGAKLTSANLLTSSLSGAKLIGANFSGANLSYAHLDNTYLWEAQLSNCNLYMADLSQSVLREADLSNVSLERANLSGVDMTNVNLVGANLKEAKFDRWTILPDGLLWESEIDGEYLLRFTDPNHPDFWSPDYASMEHPPGWWKKQQDDT